MSPKKTPLQMVNEHHGGKEKLVDKIVGLMETDEDKGELKQKLLTAANSKLLRLAGALETVKSKYGTHAKLAEAVAAERGRAKDADYVRKLGEYTSTRLLDMVAKPAPVRSKRG
jgi:hypothetical protein